MIMLRYNIILMALVFSAKFIITHNGKRYAMFKQFTYFRHYSLKHGNTRWQCTKHFSQNCGAYLILDLQGQVLKKNDLHTHRPGLYRAKDGVYYKIN